MGSLSRLGWVFLSGIYVALFSISGVSQAQASDNAARTLNPNQMRIKVRAPRHKPFLRGARGSSNAASFPDDIRTVDGSNNNLSYTHWGSAFIDFTRMVDADYADGKKTMAGESRPSPRLISNIVVATDPQGGPSGPAVSDMVWQWGQFLDHDIDLTPEVDPLESADIKVPPGDPWFDPGVTGEQVIHFSRSVYANDSAGVRQQQNVITSYVDASNVYGSDVQRANELRALDGTGKLRTSAGGLLPFNSNGLPNAMSSDASFFLAGDFRANEQVGLISMHTVFVREHNRLAGIIAADNPEFSGEEIYQTVRALVGALMQSITYNEFLPVLLGKGAMPRYRGYRPDVNASVSNEFAGAAYRFGHTMLSPQILRLDAQGNEHAAGNLPLANAFFVPGEIISHGIDPILRGLTSQRAQKVDNLLVDDVRNLLFGPPGAGGLDLASLNIQRGRDHGLASYNDTRAALGLKRVKRFAHINRDKTVRSKLDQAYGDVDQVDLWVGGLAERAVRGGLVGRTFSKILVDQFQRLRDGDRFWYQSYLPADTVRWVEQQRLSDIIKRNTLIGNELQDNVFKLP